MSNKGICSWSRPLLLVSKTPLHSFIKAVLIKPCCVCQGGNAESIQRGPCMQGLYSAENYTEVNPLKIGTQREATSSAACSQA